MCLYSSVHSFHSARDQKHTEASGFRYLLTLRFDTLGSSDAYKRYKAGLIGPLAMMLNEI